ncbi:MAG: hypothetical protein Q9170_005075 [Blastenia crenularia]
MSTANKAHPSPRNKARPKTPKKEGRKAQDAGYAASHAIFGKTYTRDSPRRSTRNKSVTRPYLGEEGSAGEGGVMEQGEECGDSSGEEEDSDRGSVEESRVRKGIVVLRLPSDVLAVFADKDDQVTGQEDEVLVEDQEGRQISIDDDVSHDVQRWVLADRSCQSDEDEYCVSREAWHVSGGSNTITLTKTEFLELMDTHDALQRFLNEGGTFDTRFESWEFEFEGDGLGGEGEKEIID